MKIETYLAQWDAKGYPALFDEGVTARLLNVAGYFGALESEETIGEVELGESTCGCDYSFKIKTEHAEVSEYWYELDDAACASNQIQPCYFIDAHAVRPGKDASAWFATHLPPLTGQADWLPALLPALSAVCDRLEGHCTQLYQIGWMQGRAQVGLRIFTSGMRAEQAIAALRSIGWAGDLAAVEALMAHYLPFAEHGQFILDFDVTPDGVSRKLGMNFGPAPRNIAATRRLLETLVEDGLCLAEKARDIAAWNQALPTHTPSIFNDISHFKVVMQPDGKLRAKAYLRQGDRPNREFSRWRTPVLMNLELTERCPLRCPQCYCALEQGRELSLETACARIADAAQSHVQVLNLSGGETLCYPHLCEVVAAGAQAGMQVNIAISGWGLDAALLHRLREAGVEGIFVSLNGSTEEINAKSRDGYALAIAALKLLQEEGVDACINWVMHSHNAEDFPKMIRLAEQFGVRELAVMVFKPDAAHSLPTVPDAEQLRAVAQQIKAYEGPVKIQVETCFSQMLALLGKRFFGNLNQGISKGCGAGRDAISIAVDGRFTPCRHLPYEEQWQTLEDYWNKSIVLQALVAADEQRGEPCAACAFSAFCRPCLAENVKLYDRIAVANRHCPLAAEVVTEDRGGDNSAHSL